MAQLKYWNGNAWVDAVIGAQGTQGPQGTTGNTGSQGLTGIQGTQGTQGTTGIQGVDGLQGIQGTQGVTGSQGLTGSEGVQGTEGIQGIQGIEGVQGIQGSQGTQGVEGSQGTQGLLGTQGTQGIQGTQGVQGTTGIQGTQGVTGASGVSSSYFEYRTDTNSQTNSQPNNGHLRYNNATQTSATAIYVNHLTHVGVDIDMFLALLQVNDNVFIQDLDNSNNYQQFKVSGAINPGANTYVQIPVTLVASGGTGTTGFANNHPVILVTTAVGIQGTTGTQGLLGSQGTQGLQGIQGIQGTTGTQGTTGSQGIQGRQGTQGIQGTQGTQGLQGVQGGLSYVGVLLNFSNTYPIGSKLFGFNNYTNSMSSVTTAYITHSSASLIGIGDILTFSAGFSYAQFTVTGPYEISYFLNSESPAYVIPVTLIASSYDSVMDPNTPVFTNNGIYGFIRSSKGIQGTTGIQGLTGTQGTQGLIGLQGTTGSQGINGTNGAQGTQGIQGGFSFGLGTGVETFLSTPSSANLAAALTDETGTGANVFATSPTLTTPKINENVELTATSTELNLLDGVTATTTELNYVDGVTSAIQTQIDTKAPLASPTFTGTVTIPTGSAITGVPYLATANTFTTSPQQITTANAETIGLIVKSTESQTANLQEWHNFDGTARATLRPTGALNLGTLITGTQLSVTPFNNTTTGIVVRGAASQSNELQQWQNSAGTTLASIQAGGNLRISGSMGYVGGSGSQLVFQSGNNSAYFTVTSTAGSYPSLIIKGISSQTSNLQEWQNSAGTALTNIGSDGRINSTIGLYTSGKVSVGGASWSGGSAMLNVWTTGTSTPGIIIRGVASQSADLTQWQDTSGTILANVSSSGGFTVPSLTVSGDLTVNGTTTNINSTNLVVEDKNIVLGDTTTPTDITADGGGITLKGTTDKTFNWVDSTDSWTSSEHINLASGKSLYLNNTLLKDATETLTNKTLTSPTIDTPLLTLSTTSSTTDGRIAWDSTNDKILVGGTLNSVSQAVEFASSTLTISTPTFTTNAYTVVLADKDKWLELSNGATAGTLNIPTDATANFAIGTQINILQTGAGQITIAAVTPGTTTVNGTPGLKLRGQWSAATIVKRSANTWVAVGDLSA
jgi:hypothetical protein